MTLDSAAGAARQMHTDPTCGCGESTSYQMLPWCLDAAQLRYPAGTLNVRTPFLPRPRSPRSRTAYDYEDQPLRGHTPDR